MKCAIRGDFLRPFPDWPLRTRADCSTSLRPVTTVAVALLVIDAQEILVAEANGLLPNLNHALLSASQRMCVKSDSLKPLT